MIDLHARKEDFFVPKNFTPDKQVLITKATKEVSHKLHRGKLQFTGKTNCAEETECSILNSAFATPTKLFKVKTVFEFYSSESEKRYCFYLIKRRETLLHSFSKMYLLFSLPKRYKLFSI